MQAEIAHILLNIEPKTVLTKAIAALNGSDVRKSTVISQQEQYGFIMEAERVNQIGNTLEDLSERTADLRRYL